MNGRVLFVFRIVTRGTAGAQPQTPRVVVGKSCVAHGPHFFSPTPPQLRVRAAWGRKNAGGMQRARPCRLRFAATQQSLTLFQRPA